MEKPEPENKPKYQPFDLVHYEKERDLPDKDPFEPTPEEMLTDDTLKAVDDKESYTPELIEAPPPIELLLEMLDPPLNILAPCANPVAAIRPAVIPP